MLAGRYEHSTPYTEAYLDEDKACIVDMRMVMKAAPNGKYPPVYVPPYAQEDMLDSKGGAEACRLVLALEQRGATEAPPPHNGERGAPP